jgi:hypothetical protein
MSDETEKTPEKAWLNQILIDSINKKIGLITANGGKPFTKGTAIFFSWFLVIFPMMAFVDSIYRFQVVIISPTLLIAILSGILAVRGAKKLGEEEWS